MKILNDFNKRLKIVIKSPVLLHTAQYTLLNMQATQEMHLM